MLGLDVEAVVQVGDSPRDLADLVVGAGTEAELGHRLLEQHLGMRIEPAELLDLPVAHRGVGRDPAVTAGDVESFGLNCPGRADLLANLVGAQALSLAAQLDKADRRHIDMQIDSIQERSGDLAQIALDLVGRAAAAAVRTAEVAARARIRNAASTNGSIQKRLFLRRRFLYAIPYSIRATLKRRIALPRK